MKFPFKTILKSENDTSEIAKEFSEVLINGDIVALNGDLGTGKTFFVKAVCKEFKILNVNSPTFAIVYEYSGSKKIYHFDFYRIKKLVELYDIGIEEYLNDEDSVVFIEWADLMSEIIPKKHYEIKLKILDNENREIQITKYE